MPEDFRLPARHKKQKTEFTPMTMLVVGLFDDQTEANAALQDLTNSGFDRGSVERRSSGSRGGSSDLFRELREYGVPEQDARAYEAGINSGDSLLYLQTTDERGDLARDIMNRHGALDIHHAHEVRTGSSHATAGMAGSASAAALGAGTTGAATRATAHTGTNEVAIPVVEEQLAVGKREVRRGGALIHTHITERPVEETVTLREEHVNVERHAVNRPVTSADTAAMREATYEVTETGEEAVVAKQARVVEEVVINKEATERTETIRDTVRRTDVDVDELDSDDVTTTGTVGGARRV
jgi:uncharacterized protein (TIGR02271 family)